MDFKGRRRTLIFVKGDILIKSGKGILNKSSYPRGNIPSGSVLSGSSGATATSTAISNTRGSLN